LNLEGRAIWIVDALRDGKSFVGVPTILGRGCEDAGRFIVRADDKLTAFVELQKAIHGFAVSLVS
jgi:hypothetical protein